MSESPVTSSSSSESPSKLVISGTRSMHNEGDVVDCVSHLITKVCQMESLGRNPMPEQHWRQEEVIIVKETDSF